MGRRGIERDRRTMIAPISFTANDHSSGSAEFDPVETSERVDVELVVAGAERRARSSGPHAMTTLMRLSRAHVFQT